MCKIIIAGSDQTTIYTMKNAAARALGKLGGAKKSKAKTRTARRNGRKGGRPRKKKIVVEPQGLRCTIFKGNRKDLALQLMAHAAQKARKI